MRKPAGIPTPTPVGVLAEMNKLVEGEVAPFPRCTEVNTLHNGDYVFVQLEMNKNGVAQEDQYDVPGVITSAAGKKTFNPFETALWEKQGFTPVADMELKVGHIIHHIPDETDQVIADVFGEDLKTVFDRVSSDLWNSCNG
jgi:hypothetical protein